MIPFNQAVHRFARYDSVKSNDDTPAPIRPTKFSPRSRNDSNESHIQSYDFNNETPLLNSSSSPAVSRQFPPAQNGETPGRKSIPSPFNDSHRFPAPEQVLPTDPIFKVVTAEIHSDAHEGTENGNKKFWIGPTATHDTCQDDGATSGSESTSCLTESSVETYSTSTSEAEDDNSSIGGYNNNNNVEHEADKISIVSTPGDGHSEGNHGSGSAHSKKSDQVKIVGYFDAPGFAVMKFTTAGKVWLWDRPEDILVIKDDGQVVDPSTIRKRSPKSYHRQVKTSMGKLYDHFFSKKPSSNPATKGNWGTTNSLDRKAVMNVDKGKRDLHISLSSYDILHSNEK